MLKEITGNQLQAWNSMKRAPRRNCGRHTVISIQHTLMCLGRGRATGNLKGSSPKRPHTFGRRSCRPHAMRQITQLFVLWKIFLNNSMVSTSLENKPGASVSDAKRAFANQVEGTRQCLLHAATRPFIKTSTNRRMKAAPQQARYLTSTGM